MESHAEQDVKMVLMHVGQYPLADGGECVFVVGQKDCLNETGAMSYPAGWDNCTRRTWCNGDYKNSLPGSLMSIFKEMKTVIDRANPLFVSDYKFKEVYLITTSADSDAGVGQAVVNGINGWIACFNGVKLCGYLSGGGITSSSDLEANPDLLKKAYDLGKNI